MERMALRRKGELSKYLASLQTMLSPISDPLHVAQARIRYNHVGSRRAQACSVTAHIVYLMITLHTGVTQGRILLLSLNCKRYRTLKPSAQRTLWPRSLPCTRTCLFTAYYMNQPITRQGSSINSTPRCLGECSTAWPMRQLRRAELRPIYTADPMAQFPTSHYSTAAVVSERVEDG